MATPALLGVSTPAASIFHLGGVLIVVTSVICMGEVFRAGRFLNVLLGIALAIAPWLLPGSPAIASFVAVAAGLLVAALSLPRGPKREHYGSWTRRVF